MSQARFQKRQREKARQEKAAAKRDRRAARLEAATSALPDTLPDALPQDNETRVLAELGELHREFADGALEFEEFEERKQSLLAQLEL